jgi:hypothetical protein
MVKISITGDIYFLILTLFRGIGFADNPGSKNRQHCLMEFFIK